ncbi:SlyX family protein [Shewanella sp. UCD-KL12]|uniref:SlyX family protein n=1 Tax=Shewanella sp. UCD-KL12 TaxID=1917163 RepID=UPI00097027A2|nr:SlyX family protein [Shewanella sp. UCD-KL12]
MEHLEQRVEDLEMKLAFQEGTIEDLNLQVIKLNDLLSDQQQAIRLLVTKLQTVEPSNMASPSEETPPPHY